MFYLVDSSQASFLQSRSPPWLPMTAVSSAVGGVLIVCCGRMSLALVMHIPFKAHCVFRQVSVIATVSN